jgi:predicted dehydrogenase
MNAPPHPIRVALLGAGTIGAIHGLAIMQVPELRVTRVWSRSGAKAQALAERLGAQTCATVTEAVNSPDVDAVLVATPTFLHAEQTLQALAAGKHVFCEKPMARTLEDASTMLAAAQAADRVLLIGHVVRFYPEFKRLRELVLEGAIGQPGVIRLARVSSFPRGSGDWHNDLERSGGVWLDMGIHDLDWLLWTLGPVESLITRGLVGRGLPYLDYALTTLKLRSGAIAHIESSWAEKEGFRVYGEIAGDGGLLAYDSEDSTALRLSLRQAPATPPGVNVPTSYTAEGPNVAQLRHWAHCMLGREAPVIAPEEALETLRVSLAGLASMRTGQCVRVTGEEAAPCA